MILVVTVYSCIATIYDTTLPYTLYDEVMCLFLASILTIIPLSRIYGKHINLVFSSAVLIVSFVLIYIGFDAFGFFIIPFLFDVALSVGK